MKIFITGATGFLGYHFTKEAINEGHEVLCLKRPTSLSLFEPEIEDRVKWVNNDNNLEENVRQFQPDILFHSAWGGVRGSDRNNREVQEDNIQLSKYLFNLFTYRQIIAIGSQAEYGYYTGPISEKCILKPENEYAKAKINTCQELKRISEASGTEWQWIRIFTVFGEKQKGGLISYAARLFTNGCKEFQTTQGEQIYNYLYSADFAKAICKVIGSNGNSGIYNLAQSSIDDYSNRQILERIKLITHSNINIEYGVIPYPENQVMKMTADISKFQSIFGQIPRTEFNVALVNTIDNK